MYQAKDNSRILSHSVIDFLNFIGVVISYNPNSDHSRYLEFYSSVIKEKNKAVLITTVGIKEFLVGFLFLLRGYSVYHIIHDWVPHPGGKYFITLLYNFLADKFFTLVFHSRSQAECYGKFCHLFPLPVTHNNYKFSSSSGRDYIFSYYITTLIVFLYYSNIHLQR